MKKFAVQTFRAVCCIKGQRLKHLNMPAHNASSHEILEVEIQVSVTNFYVKVFQSKLVLGMGLVVLSLG